tara:strand:+ start:31455 stop:33713 length:2259 start_codon:yes stop_codon:yes gene_type:complete
MADDTGNGIQRNKPLPKGMGDGKSNAQVFGILGQQVKRIGDLQRAIVSGNQALIEQLKTQHSEIKNCDGDQLQVLFDIDTAIRKIGLQLGPIAAAAIEKAEDMNRGTSIVGPGPGSIDIGANKLGKDADGAGKKVNSLALSAQGLKQRLVGGGGALVGSAAGGLAGGGVMGALTTVGIGLGVVGVGTGLLTGALYLGAKAVDKFGEGLQKTAVGLDDLNELDLIPSRFDRIGEAIENLIPDSGLRGVISARVLSGAAFTDMAKGLDDLNKIDTTNFETNFGRIGGAINELTNSVGFGGAIQLRILDGTAFNNLAQGLEALDGADFDVGKLQKAGEGIGALTREASSLFGSLGATIITRLGKASLGDVADGLTALSNVNTDDDFDQRMAKVGQGINLLVTESTSFKGTITTGQLTTIGESLPLIADGITDLQGLGDATQVEATLTQVGSGLKNFLDSTGNITDVMMTKLLNDETFAQIAKGINHLTALKVDGEGDSTNVAASLTALGGGLSNFLDGADNITGSFATKLLSGDTLSTLATGLSDINKLDIDVSKFENIGTAVDTLISGLSGEMAADKGDGALAFLQEQLTRVSGVFRNTSTRIVSGPIADIAEAMKQLDAVDALDQEILAKNADTIIKIVQNIHDDIITDDFDNFGNFLGELKELENIDIRRLNQLGETLSKFNFINTPPKDMSTQPNTQGKTLSNDAVAQIVSSVQMDNSSRTAVDNSVTTSTTKNISRVTVNPVPHRIILSK